MSRMQSKLEWIRESAWSFLEYALQEYRAQSEGCGYLLTYAAERLHWALRLCRAMAA